MTKELMSPWIHSSLIRTNSFLILWKIFIYFCIHFFIYDVVLFSFIIIIYSIGVRPIFNNSDINIFFFFFPSLFSISLFHSKEDHKNSLKYETCFKFFFKGGRGGKVLDESQFRWILVPQTSTNRIGQNKLVYKPFLLFSFSTGFPIMWNHIRNIKTLCQVITYFVLNMNVVTY